MPYGRSRKKILKSVYKIHGRTNLHTRLQKVPAGGSIAAVREMQRWSIVTRLQVKHPKSYTHPTSSYTYKKRRLDCSPGSLRKGRRWAALGPPQRLPQEKQKKKKRLPSLENPRALGGIRARGRRRRLRSADVRTTSSVRAGLERRTAGGTAGRAHVAACTGSDSCGPLPHTHPHTRTRVPAHIGNARRHGEWRRRHLQAQTDVGLV